ncbi:MAG: 6-bladed beta-propeller [Gemmatimonadaceae bacterium]
MKIVKFIPLSALLAAFAPNADSHRLNPDTYEHTQPTLRHRVQKDWKPLWRRGAKKEENLFGLPREMVASDAGVYLADGGGLEIFAFDTVGKLRWKQGRKGGGPGEYLEFTSITLDANGNVAILDARNGRVSFIDRNGVLLRTVTSGAVGWPSSVCLYANGNMLFTVADRDHFFMLTDSRGKLLREQTFPWPTKPDAPRILKAGFLGRGIATNNCWFTTTFGFGVARIQDNAASSTTPYVETVPPPKFRVDPSTPQNKGGEFLESGDNAALASFTSGDTLFVFFMGKPSSDKPLLDLYDSHGKYLESWNLPDGERVTYSHGILYTLVNSMENPTLEAWRVALPKKH